MAINYTTLLGLAQPVTGTEANTWGDAVNTQITALLDSAIAGAATISVTAGNVTLTDLDGAADQARMAILILTGTPGTTRNVVAPSRSKTYIVINQSDASAVIKGSATTGVAVRAGQAATCVWNGADFEIVASGDVDGPASATDNAVVRYDGTTGKLIQNSAVTIDDSNNVSGVVQLNATTVDTTNIEVTNLKAKDGTAAGSIADSTGVVTLASTVLTTTDINGGTIDATTIGATTPSTVVATQVDITAQGDLRLQDTAGGQYVALQAPGTVATSYTLTLPVDDGNSGQALITDGSGVLSWSSAASGDVYGPASATDNAVARYDGTTGKIIQNSAVTIADDGATVIAANSTSDGLRITQVGTGNALLVEDSANPDATPFVINANGQITQGSEIRSTIGAVTPNLLVQNNTSGTVNGMGVASWINSTAGSKFAFGKSRSTTIGTAGIVSSGDAIATVSFAGDDGVGFIDAASITAAVDGTPGTNDMPGRLVFSTTADGASSPTERMRIDSAGNVGINTATIGGASGNFRVNEITSTTTSGTLIRGDSNVNSNVTAIARTYQAVNGTKTASFTLTDLIGFSSVQGTFGAGSIVTNHYGFHVDSSLTGATNNYGFYSNIASGTGRWNFYAAGTAANVFAGTTHIGGTVGAESLRVLPVASAVNYVEVQGAITTASPAITAAGSDTNIDLTLTPKGTGVVRDASGNIRAVPKSGATKTSSYSLTTADVGDFIEIGTGGSITIPDATFATGDIVSLFNNTSGNITVTCSITTAYIAGTDSDKATVTLATRGVATILFISGTVCVINGNVT